MTVKDELHELVDQLDEEDAREALARLQDFRLPRVLREAPIDEEPETDEERAAVAEARAALAGGDIVSDAELRQQLGL